MKIEVELDEFEVDYLASLMHSQITKYRQESKLALLSKEIDGPTHEWHLGYANFIEGIKNKLFPKKFKKNSSDNESKDFWNSFERMAG